MSAKKKAAGASKKAAKSKTKKVVAAKAKKGPTKKVVAKKVAAKKGSKAGAKKPAKKAAKKVAAKPAKKLASKPAKKLASKPAKKVAAKKPAKRAAPKPKVPEMKRRDGSGHLDPAYEADLRARIESKPKDDDRAFSGDALGNELGEEFVETVTSGEDEGTELRDQKLTEEDGGPFTVTSGGTEFASGEDESNPEEATREPFPTT